ncbi:MAG: hypothetical protein ACRDJM_10580 [Actinomycetota bacterium]
MSPFEVTGAAHPAQGLLSLMAHDLRTPLGPLGLAVTSVAQSESAPQAVRELGTMAEAQGTRLARLIDATLAASGRAPYLRVQATTCSQIVEAARERFDALGGLVEADVEDTGLACDAERIRDAILGLMEVATGEGGHAMLRAGPAGGNALFRIPVRDVDACREALVAPFVCSAASAFALGALAVLRLHEGGLELTDEGFIAWLPRAAAVAEFDPGW